MGTFVSMRSYLGIAGLFLVFAAAGCAPDEGRFSLVFDWPGDGPPEDVEELIAVVSVERRDSPLVPGPVQVESDPTPVMAGVALPRVPNLDGLVAVVEVFDSAPSGRQLRYFGLSEPFTAEPGVERAIAVLVPLREPPDRLSADDLFISVGGTTRSTRVGTRSVEILLNVDGDAVSVEVANEAGFRREAGSRRFNLGEISDMEQCPPPLGTRRICTYRIPWDLDAGRNIPCPEGQNVCERQVFARIYDPYGYPSAPIDRRIILDRAPPTLVSEISGLTVLARGDILEDGAAARPGDVVRATLTVSELLASDPVLTGDLEMTLTSSGAGPYVFEGVVPEVTRPQDLVIQAALVDLADNREQVELQTRRGLLRVDPVAPSSPPVDREGAIVFRRVPFGRDEAFGASNHQLVIAPGVIEAGDFVIVEGPGGNPFGRSSVEASFGETVDLSLQDTAEIFVRTVDPAGNSSMPVQVRDVEWVLSLRGKVAGQESPNPNVVYRSGDARESLFQGFDGPGLELRSDELDRLERANDDDALSLAVQRRWVDGGTRSVNRVGTAVHDPVRGGILACTAPGTSTTGGGAANIASRWDGERWRFYGASVEYSRYGTSNGGRFASIGELICDPVFVSEVRDLVGTPVGGVSNQVYDPLLDRFVSYGGLPDEFTELGGGLFRLCTNNLLIRPGNQPSWAIVEPSSDDRPPKVCGPLLIWDPVSEAIYLAGGTLEDSSGEFGAINQEVWRLDGDRWQEVQSGFLVDALAAGLVDRSSGQSLRFDPRERSWFLERDDRIYRYDGAGWVELPRPPELPVSRGGIGILDVGRNRRFATTLEEDGLIYRELRAGRWARVGPYLTLGNDQGVAAYDADTKTHVLMRPGNTLTPGDQNGVVVYDWTGDAYTEFFNNPQEQDCSCRNPTYTEVEGGPTGRSGFLLSDAPGPGVFLFGGGYAAFSASEIPYNELFRWTPGNGWTLLDPGTTAAPSPRVFFGDMVLDTRTNLTVLFGGATRRTDGNYEPLTDTWAWDGVRWNRLLEAHPGLPSDKANGRLTFDESRNRVVLFDRETRTLWTLEGGGSQPYRWQEILLSNKVPDFGDDSQLAYDPERGRLVIVHHDFIAKRGESYELLGDTWEAIADPAGETFANRLNNVYYDPDRNRLALAGGGKYGILTAPDRPSLLVELDVAAARREASLPFSAFQELVVRTVGGGDGLVRAEPASPDAFGLELAVWERDVGGWRTLAANGALPEAPSPLTGTAIEARRFVIDDKIYLRIQPRGVEYGAKRSRMAVDYLEAVVRYRLPETCGDGAFNEGEECDDGNLAFGDGCSSTCEIEAGFTCGETFPSVCFNCGNGVVEAGEECDPGTTVFGGCTDMCRFDLVARSVDTGTITVDGRPNGVEVGTVRFEASNFAARTRVAEVEVEVDLLKTSGTCAEPEPPGAVNAVRNQEWQELGIWLEGPPGMDGQPTRVDLIRVGDFADNIFTGGLRYELRFDDDALLSPKGLFPVFGVPLSPAERLSRFDGLDPVGEWRLFVADDRSPAPVCVYGFSVSVAALFP